MSELRNVSNNEVEIAKQTLKARISTENTVSWKRLEDRTKSLFYNGSTQENIIDLIDQVTAA